MTKCIVCDTEFDSQRKSARYCSPKCRMQSHRKGSAENPIVVEMVKVGIFWGKEGKEDEYFYVPVEDVAVLREARIPDVIPDMEESEKKSRSEAVTLDTPIRKVFNTEPCSKHHGFKGTCGCT